MTGIAWRSNWLAARMGVWVLVLHVLVRVLPLPRVVRIAEPRSLTSSPHQRDVRRIVALAQAVTSRATRRPETMCLVRSLVAYRYLARAGVRPELHVGFERTEGTLRGHAWVVVEGAPVTDRADAIASLMPTMAFVPPAR
jgi:Transglutaminase-like superfamily